MSAIKEALSQLLVELPEKVTLVAVSKTKPATAIVEAYSYGQRDFGENKVQELVEKWETLPKDINWHMIGHLQRNKVKYIAPFVHLIHGIDSLRLLEEVNKQGAKIGRKIAVLLQVHIAEEETKFGLDTSELETIFSLLHTLNHIEVKGLMGMATFTSNQDQIRGEFTKLKSLFDSFQSSFSPPPILSMGMSGDYQIAIEEGSTLIRIGSSLFGSR